MKRFRGKDRYMFQPWYVKLWRNRWQLYRPWWALKDWLNDKDGFSFIWYWKETQGVVDLLTGNYATGEEWENVQ